MARLRKCLKTRRVTSIKQVGTDRIIELQFSDGLYRLYFEFYAGGNIVLTDGDLKVLALLRNVEEGAEHEQLRLGLQYNLSLRQNYGGIPDLTKQRVQDGLQKAVDRQREQPTTQAKKARKQQKDTLRKALAVSITECPPLLVDHALHVAEFDSTLKPEEVLADDRLLENLLGVMQQARKISEDITTTSEIKGYILAKPNPAATQGEEDRGDGPAKSNLLYDDFHPFQPQQFKQSDYTFLEFDGFNKCVDEFFSSIEGQKLESKLHERELHARKKLDQARKEHESRIGGLQQTQELNFRKAEAILANIHRVEEAIAAVNGLIGQGMDWGEIARLIEREQDQGNAVAQLIKLPLKLHENTVTLDLEEADQDEGAEEEDEGYGTSSAEESSDEEDQPSQNRTQVHTSQPSAQPKLSIDIDLGLTAYKNSSEYFDQKKTAKGKEARTVEASEKAMKAHERKVAEDLKKGLKQEKEVLRPMRRQQWFEKFIHFISSDGYLVLGGKDGPQNEIIYRRYLRKGDVYVHADLKGAVPMVIKNNPNTPDSPIPPSTLSQAGHLSVCTSEAWDSKAVMSAWWVKADQVSKLGHGGEFLAPGLFNITGRKEFLPPAQLVVGLAVMFEISEESKARHRKHRVNDPIPSTEPPSAIKDDLIGADDKAEESDSDEDFPDAKPASESDDDDFPDTKLDESDESDVESDNGTHTNPLQTTNGKALWDNEDDGEEPRRSDPHPQKFVATSEPPQDDSGSVADTEKTSKAGHRHLSARERRLIRKGQPLDDISPPSDPASTANAGAESDGTSGDQNEMLSANKPPATVTSQASKVSKGPLPRGKRAKAKKLAAKYADQDEEDRQLALRLLGAQSGPSAAETIAQEKRSKEEEIAANKQRRREQHLRAQATGKAAEEARKAATGGTAGPDDDGADDEALVANLNNLDAFVGRPLPEDEILSAIPICAPWSALATYKYKAKMQPGSMKRGKAVKDILSKWDNAGKDAKATDRHGKDVERIWPKEMELIRGWKEPEVVSVVSVAKVRVMMAGGRDGGGLSANPKGKKKSARGGKGSKKR